MPENNCNSSSRNTAPKKQTMGASSSGGSEREHTDSSSACKHVAARKSIQDVAMISSRAVGAETTRDGESSGQQINQPVAGSAANPETVHPASCPLNNANNLGLDQSAQLRSTLAIGQLIASNRPTAGSRLIANELRQLSKTIKEESASIRREVSNLSNNLATTLKRVLDDDREQRNLGVTGGLARRPMFGSIAARRFPVFRRPRRPLQTVQRYNPNNANDSTSPNETSPLSASTSGLAAKTSSTGTQTPEVVTGTTQKQTALKLSGLAAAKSPTAVSAAKALAMVFKGPWLALDRAYDGEIDSDSNETTPSSSP